MGIGGEGGGGRRRRRSNTPERWSRKKNRRRKTERQEACDGEGSLPGGPEDGLAAGGGDGLQQRAETILSSHRS